MQGLQNIELNKVFRSAVQFWSALLLSFMSCTAMAEIFQWVDSNGKIHFTDNPPETVSVKKLKLKINSFTNPDVKPFKFNSSLISNRKTSRDVIMYGASWCGYCKKAKKYFKKNHIPFVEYDVETSGKGKRDYKKLKGNGVPIILVGNQRMNGFSEAGFNNMYKRK